jgi:hypothetical protein
MICNGSPTESAGQSSIASVPTGSSIASDQPASRSTCLNRGRSQYYLAIFSTAIRENWIKLINCEVTRGHSAHRRGDRAFCAPEGTYVPMRSGWSSAEPNKTPKSPREAIPIERCCTAVPPPDFFCAYCLFLHADRDHRGRFLSESNGRVACDRPKKLLNC